jgi:fatty acid desaturase
MSAAPTAPPPREFMHLSARSDGPGFLRLGFHLGLIGVAGWLIAVAPGLLKLPAILLMALAQSALFAPMHETSHYTAFRTRWLNPAVGWVVGLPALHNWHFYREFHLAHHRHTQVPGEDPELDDPTPRDLSGYLLRIGGLYFWRARLAVIADAWTGRLAERRYIHPAVAPRVIASVRASSATVLALALGSGIVFGWQAPLLFWVLPQLVGQVFLRLYLLSEHTGCTLDRNGLTNTRTMMTNPAVRLLMWQMPYHAEHHLYPFIPFHRLAEAHRALKARLAHVGPGYARWNAGFWRELRGR